MSQYVRPVSTEYSPRGSQGSRAPMGSREPQRPQGSRKNAKKGIWNVVLVISVIVLVGSLVALGVIGYSYWESQQKYTAVAEKAQFDPSDAMQSGGDVDLSAISIDWDALKAINGDIVGWVYIPHTRINYPIVRADDNDYYLSHDFEYQEGWIARCGTPFMDYRNERDWSDLANFVYGHHLNDGTMFADITGLKEQKRFDECRTVYLLTPQGNYRLRSFSLVHCSAYDPIVQTKFYSAGEFESYVQDKMNRSIVAVGSVPAASEIGKVFAFTTCDGEYLIDARHILMCYIEATTVPGETAVGEQGSDSVDQDTVSAIGDETSYAIDPLGVKDK